MYASVTKALTHLTAWNEFWVRSEDLSQLYFAEEMHDFPPRIDLENANELQATGIEIGDTDGKIVGPISISLFRGTLWAVVGASRSGKSALLEVLMGLQSAISGTVLVKEFGKVLWSRSVDEHLSFPLNACAAVEQVPYLFEGTIRENLTFGNERRLSDAILWDVLSRTDLGERIRQLGGLDSVLSARGEGLSVGERYRLALSRALLLKRPFLLLDNPFHEMDERSTLAVVRALDEERQSAGVLLTANVVPAYLRLDGFIQFENAVSIRTVPDHSSLDSRAGFY